jgi:hypothetical protein
MYEAAATKDIARAPVTTWKPQCVTFAGYGYAVRHGMKVQLVTPYRASHLQRYGVTVRGNVTSVYPPTRGSQCKSDIIEKQARKCLQNYTASHRRR